MNFDRQPIADHAQNLATNIKSNLQRSLEAIGVVSSTLSLESGQHSSLDNVYSIA